MHEMLFLLLIMATLSHGIAMFSILVLSLLQWLSFIFSLVPGLACSAVPTCQMETDSQAFVVDTGGNVPKMRPHLCRGACVFYNEDMSPLMKTVW